MRLKLGVAYFCAVVATGFGSAAAYASGGCFLSLERPLLERASWSMQCNRDPQVSGTSINRLDAIGDCGSQIQSCFSDPSLPITIDSALARSLSLEGATGLPSCYPSNHPQWVRMGYAHFHRSCFRTLSDSDSQNLRSLSERARGECRYDFFGSRGQDSSGRAVRDFLEQNPPAFATPSTSAEAIYASFREVIESTNSCLIQLNPALAERVLQAMGVHPRGSGEPNFRPAIECEEQMAFECDGKAERCEGVRDGLAASYRARNEGFEEELRHVLRDMNCRPAHGHGAFLGSIDAGALAEGQLLRGSPHIRIYNPTALFNRPGASGRSTLFHEFLHAAGASAIAQHNEGAHENELPEGDQVYACQAVVYRSFFDRLAPAQLRAACALCADAAHQGICARPARWFESHGCRRP